MSTTTIDTLPDGARIRSTGFVEVFDADKLRHAIDRGKVRRFTRGDGSVEDAIRALEYGQCTKQDLIDGFRPSLWVPRDELLAAGYVADDELEYGHNLWTTAGWARILANLTAVPASTAVFDATHTRLGVGNGTTAAAIGNTDLAAAAGSANRQFKLVDGAPTVGASGGTGSVAWTATFPTGNGNFVWAEWTVDNGTADGTTVTAPMLNRAVPNSLITKTSAAAVALTVTLAGT